MGVKKPGQLSIVTRLRAGRPRFDSRLGDSVQTGSGAHPASYPTCTESPFLWNKAAGGKADHPPPSSAEVKRGAIPLLPPLQLHCMVLS
jgi:hypothetical protein